MKTNVAKIERLSNMKIIDAQQMKKIKGGTSISGPSGSDKRKKTTGN